MFTVKTERSLYFMNRGTNEFNLLAKLKNVFWIITILLR